MNLDELMKNYKVIDKPKKGGQKKVFRALDSNGKEVALKVILNSADPRVLQEIKILKQISGSSGMMVG